MRLVFHPGVYSDVEKIMTYYEQIGGHGFPYHFLFRIVGDDVRVLTIRHHRRHLSLGVRRR